MVREAEQFGRAVPPFSYFIEWGGRPWERLCEKAFGMIGSLNGKRVLEIGPRFGKLSSYLALMGAEVTGIETSASVLKQAEEEVRRWGVQGQVSFIQYDGDLDHCRDLEDGSFDLVFTKSVLVLLGDGLTPYLRKLDRKLKQNGQCAFVENGRGGPLAAIARGAVHRHNFGHITYFTSAQVESISDVFETFHVTKTYLPPIYLVLAKKRRPAGSSLLDG